MTAMIKVNPKGGPHQHLVSLTIPDGDWEPEGVGRYSCRLAINGVGFNLTAIEVTDRSVSDIQSAVDHENVEEFAALHAAFYGDGHYQTITIAGREHAVFGDLDC